MLKIELVRFEAQDVITASGTIAPIKHTDTCTKYINGDHKQLAAYNNGVPNQIYVDGAWVVCGCDCHK